MENTCIRKDNCLVKAPITDELGVEHCGNCNKRIENRPGKYRAGINTLTIIEDVKFDGVFRALKDGYKAYRQGWNGTKRGVNMYVYLVDKHDAEPYEPFFVFYNEEHETTNIWMPSIWDMMATDWVIVKEDN